MKHAEFKAKLTDALTTFKKTTLPAKRFSLEVPIPDFAKVHVLKLIQKPKKDEVEQERKNNRYH